MTDDGTEMEKTYRMKVCSVTTRYYVLMRLILFLTKTSVDAFVVGNPEVEDSNVEVPKVLGDLFEALVCAVFLDCGMNLDCVWGVFYPMFQPFIGMCLSNFRW